MPILIVLRKTKLCKPEVPMYPYNGRPTEEFLRDYNLKLRELQELIESLGMNLQLKPGGRCVVVPATSKNTETIDKSHLINYSQQYNANLIDSEDSETTETAYETYEDYLDFERKLALIHEAKDSDIVVDFSAEFLDLAPIIEEKLMFKEEAQLYGRFCQEVIRILNGASSKTIAWKQITKDYNNSKLVAELRYKKGPRKERALREWLRNYYDNKMDMYALLHKSKGQYKDRKITYQEQQYLLHLLLNPNRIKIGSAIVNLKQMSRNGIIESQANERTLRRWCEEWAARHPAEWYQARDGSKFVSENLIKSIMRDDSTLEVGQVWVADGHTLSFDILNPQTGRAQRMTMIMVMDWASRYPVGASLAFTEDSQHILTAFRNGFINCAQIADNNSGTMAVLPKYVYLDNGKAFRAKLFHERWEEHDLNKELGGIFPRLNIGVRFAESYNAKAKIIERFFKTFQEQFERFITTFRGASIDDKPSILHRNEVWAKKLYTGKPPTIEETMQMIAFYVRFCYGETPHTSLNRRTPYEVFSAARIAESRQIEISRLNFLMMAMERKNIRAEGIRLDKKVYWHRELVNHVGQPCIIRFDYSDARWIVVYDKNDVFICQAALRKAQHPFIEVSMDKAVSHKELNKEYNEIKGLRREKERNAKKWVVNSQKAVDKILSNSTTKQEKLEDHGARAIFNSPPMLEAPPKDSDEIIEEMTRKAMLRLPKHPDMLSPEERVKLETEEKERLAKEEIERIIDQEIKESFDRIGLDYQGSNVDTPISWKTAFSKTAREYYKSTDQDSNGDVGILISTASVPEPDATKPVREQTDNSEPIEDTNTLTHSELLTDNQQQQTDVDKEPKPFAHLSRAELLKRIGITN
ncbi:MAG: Mu transposase C-terminal domain-containing protein [Candidatus Cloacimonadaceae bacterium]|nr:Mu transposase C-terminal domain-containing protein [Candidatus Cloacimonadota bacterium]MCB5260744.1 Mu transposase C-terminal domain-containing protein [Candidatus Cloacimonadota bacterium]